LFFYTRRGQSSVALSEEVRGVKQAICVFNKMVEQEKVF
jgi:hypothetical protein